MKKKLLTTLFLSGIILAGCSSLPSTTNNGHTEAATPKHLLDETNRLIEEGQGKAALAKMLPYAQRGTGDGQAEGVVGYIYDNMLKDTAEAIKWYKKSAQKGNATSLYNLGGVYYNMRDYARAFDYYEDAAESGDTQAVTMLGIFYYYGYDVSRNYRKSIEYFQRGVQLGDELAYYYLGISYMESHGVAQDLNKARELLTKAKAFGIKGAEQKLAELER